MHQANIYYEDIGEGIPILFIHGYSPDHRLMSGCMEPIFKGNEGWRRIYIDLPGMGLTTEYDEISSSDGMLNAVIEFIQTLLPNQAFVIAGESYGAYIARGVIEKLNLQILGAIFICPVIIPLIENRKMEVHRVIKQDNDFIQTLSNKERANFQSNQVILDEYNWLRYKQEIVAGVELADEPFLDKVEKQYSFSFEVDKTNFDKPCAFLLGRQDGTVGYKDALDIMDKYPRGTFAVLDTAGHNLQIEQPDIFNSLVRDCLNRISTSDKD